MVSMPRVLIAGTHSGVGKTTVALGVMSALAGRGLRVQPFKVGPDYIDPGFHTVVTGRISRNLDTWLLKERMVRAVFQRACAGAGIAVVEGVMGLFDGHSATRDRGSTAEVARLLQIPVVLIVDAKAMARSVSAVVRGYAEFDRGVKIAGVILNRVSSGHFRLLRDALRHDTDVPLLGYLAPDGAIAMPERHLGLVPAQEVAARPERYRRLSESVAATIDLPRILRIAKDAPPLPEAPGPWRARARQRSVVRIGVARDEAFHFYYQENLDLLRASGAEIVEFSPLTDRHLPEGLDALYLGGGFPEVFARALSRNASMRRQVKREVQRGVPTYAECGGLMYLAQRLIDSSGTKHAMAGVLPGTVRMTDRLRHFGYVTVRPRRRTILSKAGDPIRGHEFHHSVWEHPIPAGMAAYTATKRRQPGRLEGLSRGNLLASYVHVHFLTNVRWAHGFVLSAQRWRKRQAEGTWKGLHSRIDNGKPVTRAAA